MKPEIKNRTKKITDLLQVKVLITLLAIAAIFTTVFLTSCEKEPPEGPDDTTVAFETLPDETTETKVSIVSDKKTDFEIIRAAEASSKVLKAANNMSDTMNATLLLGSGTYTYPKRDTEEEKANEILVGNTNRKESAQAIEGLGNDDYIVKIIGTKLVINGTSDEAIANGLEWFTEMLITGHDSLELAPDFCYICSKAPSIFSISQEDYYFDFSTNAPEITITLAAPDGSNPEIISYVVDGKNVLSQVKTDNNSLTLSGIEFADGMHTATLTMKSADGYLGIDKYYFGCGKCEDMNLYKGEIHAHTVDSDGTGTAREAYEYARDVAKLDFFAVTDHSGSFTAARYVAEHIPLANELNEPGKFVALYGYEQGYGVSTGYYGHLNTINTDVYALSSLNLPGYYKLMAKTESGIVQFNHPGYSWGNFLEYGLYSEEYDKVVNLYEFKGSGYDNEWALCLAKGWHVSPMHNEDNHQGQWGTVNEAVGYVLAPSLTRQNITEAMNMKRTYTTTDQSLKIYYSINDTWLGGTLENPESLNVKVKLSTSKSIGLGMVYIVAEDNIIVAFNNAGTKKTLDWELTLSPEYDYYYVKVVNGTSTFAVTAPVWVEGRDMLNIKGLDRSVISYDNNSNKDHRISAEFSNDSTETMTDVKVSFYASALSGFDITKVNPSETVKIGTLEAGKTANAYADLAYVASTPRITVVVTGKIGDKVYSDTKYLQISPLLITEICSQTGYSYVEIYNATDDAISLSNYKVRLWPKPGTKSDELSTHTQVLSGTIAPHSVKIVWLKTTASLTLADFNKQFKCNLTENDIIQVASTLGAPTGKSVQFEILNGSTVIARAQYNFGTDKTDISTGKSVLFTYQTAYTLTEVKTKKLQSPTPGTFNSEYMPALIEKAG